MNINTITCISCNTLNTDTHNTNDYFDYYLCGCTKLAIITRNDDIHTIVIKTNTIHIKQLLNTYACTMHYLYEGIYIFHKESRLFDYEYIPPTVYKPSLLNKELKDIELEVQTVALRYKKLLSIS